MRENEEASGEPEVREMSGNANVRFEVTGNAAWGVAMSLPHVAGANHFANELEAHEMAVGSDPSGETFGKAHWYASAAILLSFAAVESSVDEVEDALGLPKTLSATGKHPPFWQRLDEVIAHAHGKPIEKGKGLYQRVGLLKDLRDGLAHPKLDWSNALKSYPKLTQRIVDQRLTLSPLRPDPATAFPYGCMSAGVARWAAKNARDFIQDFRVRCGLEPYGSPLD